MSLESNDTATSSSATVLNVENDDTPSSVDAQTPVFSVTGIQQQQRGGYVLPNKMNMLRSPSRESVGTDISLFSVSTLASELTSRMKLLSVKIPGDGSISRGPSPNFDRRRRPENIQEVWFEESNDMIRGMAALSSAVGLSKSFSTSDITDLLTNDEDNAENGFLPVKRNAISELAISASQHSGYLFEQSVKLDNASRSCSTWVAVGDMPSTSQLPSPHGGAVPSAVLTSNTPACGPSFTPADLIRSVNKKVRQHYIRRRLMTTYKALERLSQSEFNLDKLELEAAASTKTSGNLQENRNSTAGFSGDHLSRQSTASNRLSVPGVSSGTRRQWKNTPALVDTTEERLTINDVERERGQPLSKYDRNMMIFNWLLTLEPDECSVETY
ncbi:uncharacterized protein LOC135849937 [Planococcus citri]|uniref:uncharacterized protein LOC135849937 n=1 Tax=Planococcus citri TaxID=170843 RepID=UPI0031F78033